MLVKRLISPVSPQPTVPLDPSNRPTSPESNIQEAIERQFAQAEGLGCDIYQPGNAMRFMAT